MAYHRTFLTGNMTHESVFGLHILFPNKESYKVSFVFNRISVDSNIFIKNQLFTIKSES